MAAEATDTFLSHLTELRQRLINVLIGITAAFLLLINFSGYIYELLAIPLVSSLAPNQNLIATEITSPFLSPIKLVLFLSVYLTMPITLYNIWAFIAPALYRTEKKFVLPLMTSCCLLFYSGILFCYLLVFPLIFDFLQAVVPKGVTITPDINEYLGFALKMFFSFGIAFQVPVIVVLLVKAGITTRKVLASHRKAVIPIAFTVGMLLTPPDMISQTLLALPMLLLFELGLLMSRLTE